MSKNSHLLGLRVRLKDIFPTKHKERYIRFHSQSKGSDGTIVETGGHIMVNGEEAVRVKWDNGEINSYPISTLEFIEESNTESEQEEIKIGQKVCLNPECVDIDEYGSAIREYDAGYVVKILPRGSVRLAFDSNRNLTLTIRKDKLLLINAPLADITEYSINNFGEFYTINNEDSRFLNKLIIRDRYKINNVVEYKQGVKITNEEKEYEKSQWELSV